MVVYKAVDAVQGREIHHQVEDFLLAKRLVVLQKHCGEILVYCNQAV